MSQLNYEVGVKWVLHLENGVAVLRILCREPEGIRREMGSGGVLQVSRRTALASSVFSRIARTQRLPSPSATALKLVEMAEKPDVSVKQIADLIATDPAMSARILKYANSPMVGPRQAITSVQGAVSMLGVRSVKVTALGFSLVRRGDYSKCPKFDYDLYWAHATAIATAARSILSVARPGSADEAFVAGLLARIGRLAFVTSVPEEYEEVLARLPNVMCDGIREEQSAFGATHAEVGAELLEKWKLPAVLVDAVRYQMNPDAAPTPEIRQIAHAISLGRQIADILCGVGGETSEQSTEYPIPMEEIETQFRQTARLLELSLEELPDPEAIEDHARELADELSLVSSVEGKKLEERAKELENQALTDSMTGLGNRKAFDEKLASEVERARRHKRPMALLILDLDHFKHINDSYGHPVGDEVLAATGRAIGATIRKCDFAARYGGEEFAVIAGESNLDAAMVLAERLRRVVAAITINTQQGPISPTISVGVCSVMEENDGLRKELRVVEADKQLYAAKRAGRNRIVGGILGSSPTRNAKLAPV